MMSRRIRQIGWLFAALSLLAACAGPEAEETTSTSSEASPATTTAPTVADTTSTTTTETTSTTVGDRDFETAACGELSGVLLCEAYELIQRHYVDPVSDADLVDAAVSALAGAEIPSGTGIETCPLPSGEFLALCDVIDDAGFDGEVALEEAVTGMAFLGLDPNSAYFNAEALTLIEEEQSGQVEGIGALVATEEEGSDQPNSCQIVSPSCRLRIVSTIEGGPAQAALLQPGDEFLRVDGESIEGWTVDEVTSVVRGPAGTDVELTFLREEEEFTITITRAAIEVPVVQSEVVGEVAYLRLNVFTDNADEQLRAELERMLADDPASLVLDLRNNPGGLLETAVQVTSEFVDGGLVVSTQSPESTTPYEVQPGGVATDPDLRLYVVVNQGSASASEVVAGALADAGRATIVGENTFGKNTVQQRFPLSNGGALKLTIARWLTPEGRDFGGDGITPDVTAELPESLTVPELVAAVTGGTA